MLLFNILMRTEWSDLKDITMAASEIDQNIAVTYTWTAVTQDRV
jgi:hypothetical protein